MAGKFTRFSEKRDTVLSDITTYDDAVDGIEPDESAGLHIPIGKDNVGFKLIQKMGWDSGRGLGKNNQGRIDPVPLKPKDDFMGLGKFQQELDLAAEATEKRRQLEIEKEITPDLIHKYKNQIDKEKTIAESTSDLRQSYYCDLCDKQYNRYSEYDNHLNSYDHHHRQRLKGLKDYEVGRLFGVSKVTEDPSKKAAAYQVAVERAEMRAMRQHGMATPSFKPMGYRHSKSNPTTSTSTSFTSDQISNAAITSALRKRSGVEIMESEKKIADKKARLEKFGVKFQAAGHLATIDNNELSSYQTKLLDSSKMTEQTTERDVTGTMTREHSLYAGRFVLAGEDNNTEQSTDDTGKEERDKRLSSLPQARGRHSEKLAAVEATTRPHFDDDSSEDDESGFGFGGKRRLGQQLGGRQKVKLPVKQMSLKLSNKFESYYH